MFLSLVLESGVVQTRNLSSLFDKSNAEYLAEDCFSLIKVALVMQYMVVRWLGSQYRAALLLALVGFRPTHGSHSVLPLRVVC